MQLTNLSNNRHIFFLSSQQPFHPKTNKGPWITVDGIDVADSQLSIEKLSEVFGIDLFKDLDKRQKALSESMRIMIEEQFYWILVQDRYDVLNFGRNLGIRSSDKSKRNKNKNLKFI